MICARLSATALAFPAGAEGTRDPTDHHDLTVARPAGSQNIISLGSTTSSCP
ncbi:MAG: hypothetical protein ACU0CI_13050 [Shimia sp.]